ncbi:MAG: serine/threonine protein kinase [Deltaproteobacteria bacterium]|nr:serine/threonine protein kinase [Deltaproteobacteria bacterium]
MRQQASLLNMTPGTILDKKYRIDDVIGSGGMGHVYRATNIILKREVAVKTLQVHKGSDDAALHRFHQEAQIAASIGHDNICEVIDFGTHHPDDGDFDVYYLIMPLLNGQSLGQWFDSWVGPSPPLFVDIIAQTLLGLHAAHQKKIVHRDMKPDNIFITHIGDRDNFVKLLDFGISKYLESDAALSLTQTGIAMGTPLYMAPEQAKGSRYIDHTADIYSVGVVLYEGFVGQLPYTGDNFNDVLLKIATKPFPAPRRVNPDVPLEIEAVILKAMSKSSKDRYTSALQMRHALLRAAAAANIDDRKSFVYPSSIPPGPRIPAVKTVSIEPTVTSGAHRRYIEAKLREVTGMTQVSQTDVARPAVESSRGTFTLLIGIIIVSLVVALVGVAFILSTQRTKTNHANIVPVSPTLLDDTTSNGAVVVVPAASPGLEKGAVLPPTVELPEVRHINGEGPDVTAPEDGDNRAVSGASQKSPAASNKKSKASSRGVKGPAIKVHSTTSDRKASSTAAGASAKTQDATRDRFIERDVDSIFD